jgi:hypothetical protein
MAQADPHRTSVALATLGSLLVLTATAYNRSYHSTEGQHVTTLTLILLGSACFVGNIQRGSPAFRLIGASALLLSVAAARHPVAALF